MRVPINKLSLSNWTLSAAIAACVLIPGAVAQDRTGPQKTEVRFVSRASDVLDAAFPTSDLATSPDQRWLAVAREDGRVELRHAANSRLSRIAVGHVGPVYRVRFGPRASRLASAGHDGTVRVWSLPDLALERTIQVSDRPILAVVFVSQSRLATGGYGGRVRTWDVADGHEVAARDIGATVRCLDVAAEETLAVGADDKSVSLLTTADLSPKGVLPHESGASAVAFTPNGEFLFSGTQSGVVSCWRVEEGKRFYRHTTTSPVSRLAVSSDGALVLAGADDGTVSSYRVATGEKLAEHTEGRTLSGANAAGIAIGADDKSAWVCSRKAVVRFDAERAKLAPMLRFPSDYRVWGLAVLPTSDDELQVAYGGKRGLLNVADLKTGMSGDPRQHPTSIDRLAISNDGRHIATVGWKSPELGLWAVAGDDRKPATTKEPLRAAAISPDGANVIGLGKTGVLTEWNVTMPTVIARTVAAHATTGNWVSYRHDGKLIATSAGVWQSTELGEVKLWDAKELKPVRTMKFPTTWAQCSQFAPNGPLLAIALGNRQVRIYDSEQNKQVVQFVHTHAIRTLCWSHDGRFLAVGALNGVVTVWSIDRRKRVGEYGGLDDVFAVQFAHGDHTLLAAGGGREWVAWDVSSVTESSQPQWLREKGVEGSQ